MHCIPPQNVHKDFTQGLPFNLASLQFCLSYDASAGFYDTLDVLPTACAGHSQYVLATELAGFDIKIHLIESTIVSRTKAEARARANECRDKHLEQSLPQQEILCEPPGRRMLSLKAGHLQILGLQALSMAALLQAHLVIKLLHLVGLASLQSCSIFR